MTRDEFIAEMVARGWEKDKYGHLQKEVTATDRVTGEKHTRKLRCKMQSISVRIERQVIYAATQYTKEEKAWVRIESAYLKDIKKEDGKIKVGRYKFLPIGEAHTHG